MTFFYFFNWYGGFKGMLQVWNFNYLFIKRFTTYVTRYWGREPPKVKQVTLSQRWQIDLKFTRGTIFFWPAFRTESVVSKIIFLFSFPTHWPSLLVYLLLPFLLANGIVFLEGLRRWRSPNGPWVVKWLRCWCWAQRLGSIVIFLAPRFN